MPALVLRPCPWCGAKGRKLRVEPWTSVHGTDGFVIDCRGCEAVGPIQATQLRAKHAWNKRRGQG